MVPPRPSNRKIRLLFGQFQNLVFQRERGFDSFARHLTRVRRPYTLHESAEAISRLERNGFFDDAHSRRFGLSSAALALNHLLCEQILRDGVWREGMRKRGFTKPEKKAIRRAYRAYAM
ncbi:MAG: hypothetical protein Q8P02_05060, partial [Candidatus Micrarchaeota archaeon]|nr:hypothetical protein [Candidatus Micrarchaeota archaeon]